MSGNILFLLANLSASADVVVSEPLFFFLMENSLRSELASENRSDSQELQKAAGEKAAAVVETLLAQNFIQRDKGSFKTSASYKSGKVTINGRKLNIMDLLKSPLPE